MRIKNYILPEMIKRVVISILFFLTISIFPIHGNNTAHAIEPSDTNNINQGTEDLLSRNLFIEFGGAAFGVGIVYDQRFRSTSVFGFSAGLAFTSGSWDNGGWWGAYDGGSYTQVDFKGVTLPLEVNAIMGKRASKFELGVGATPCVLHRYEVSHWGWHPEYSGNDIKDGIKLNIFGSLNIGYRLQRKSGFFLRTGLTFLIADLKCSPMDGLLLVPNLSLGYTIR